MRVWATLALAWPCVAVQDAFVIPRLVHARAQLELARECRVAMGGLEGGARARACAIAVSAYRAVGEYFPASSAAATEADFRAAELLRAGGDFAAAAAGFRRVAGRSGGGVLAARARLEAGHLLRRDERLLEALAVCGSLALDPRTPRRERRLGSLWSARLLAQLGHAAAARAIWSGLARRGGDPLLSIRAFDDWGVSLADEGDLEAAAGVLHRCRERLAGRAAERTELGRRIRRALERMRLVPRLVRGVRERRAWAVPYLVQRAHPG